MESQSEKVLGHPKGLFFLFFTEMWERFSFYGMRALLTLYMAEQLFVSLKNGEEIAYGIYAAYGALVYATPLLGGLIADRLLGYRKAIMLGAILMALGHFAMAFENDVFFYGALGLLIVGNGFFKPNISTLVGSLYGDNDPKRDAGFTIFYLGINVGAFLAPLVCGWLGASYGWHYGFGAAGIGMLLGLVVFWVGTRVGVFLDKGYQPDFYKERKFAGLKLDHSIYLIALMVVPLFAYLVRFNETMSLILFMVLAGIIIYLIILMTQSTKIERERMLVIVIITLALTVFGLFSNKQEVH